MDLIHGGVKRFSSGIKSENLRLLYDSWLQRHRAETIDLAIDVVVFRARPGIEIEPNIAHLCARFQRLLSAFDLHCLGNCDGVTVGKLIAHAVLNHGAERRRGLFMRFSAWVPLVCTLGADEHGWEFVGEFTGALGASWQSH